jgi:hypothetical protein
VKKIDPISPRCPLAPPRALTLIAVAAQTVNGFPSAALAAVTRASLLVAASLHAGSKVVSSRPPAQAVCQSGSGASLVYVTEAYLRVAVGGVGLSTRLSVAALSSGNTSQMPRPA